jgi:hypothetical protein
MKIIDGIKYEGNPYAIPGTSRKDLPESFSEMGYKVGAEIGVYKGWNSRRFAVAGLKIFAIDPWIRYPYFKKTQEELETIYHKAWKHLRGFENATIIRKSSMDAVKDFEDESLDFVYIDGDHRFKFVTEDIYEWSKKVRKGGVISGHDYVHPRSIKKRKAGWAWATMHVKFAVDAYTEAYQIKNWWVVESLDIMKSFMWFKE